METLKQIANRKLIAITMAVKAIIIFISASVSYYNISLYFNRMPTVFCLCYL